MSNLIEEEIFDEKIVEQKTKKPRKPYINRKKMKETFKENVDIVTQAHDRSEFEKELDRNTFIYHDGLEDAFFADPSTSDDDDTMHEPESEQGTFEQELEEAIKRRLKITICENEKVIYLCEVLI